MENLGQKYNFILFKKIGVSYMRGWSDLGCSDMKQRVRNILSDVKEKTKDINFSLIILIHGWMITLKKTISL